jgi:hypothetical protein
MGMLKQTRSHSPTSMDFGVVATGGADLAGPVQFQLDSAASFTAELRAFRAIAE